MLTFVSEMVAIRTGDMLLWGVTALLALSQAVAEPTTDSLERQETFSEVLGGRDNGQIVRLEAESYDSLSTMCSELRVEAESLEP